MVRVRRSFVVADFVRELVGDPGEFERKIAEMHTDEPARAAGARRRRAARRRPSASTRRSGVGDAAVGQLMEVEAFVAKWTLVHVAVSHVFADFLLHIRDVRVDERLLLRVAFDPKLGWNDKVARDATHRTRSAIKAVV